MLSTYIMRRIIIPYNRHLKKYARWLRNHPTQAEKRLWKYLKGKQVKGYDFHRQKPIDNYILDFFCHELMLGIEVDGITHEWEETKIKDNIKESILNDLGITILRFEDDAVMNEPDEVMGKIEEYVRKFEAGEIKKSREHTP